MTIQLDLFPTIPAPVPVRQRANYNAYIVWRLGQGDVPLSFPDWRKRLRLRDSAVHNSKKGK